MDMWPGVLLVLLALVVVGIVLMSARAARRGRRDTEPFDAVQRFNSRWNFFWGYFPDWHARWTIKRQDRPSTPPHPHHHRKGHK
jgi:hypothetical protein